jgi:DNA-binding PadR family transcriptional regulator
MYDLVLLAALLAGPAYGYALKRTAGFIFGSGTLHNNVIYPALKKFVRNGWVAQTAVPGDRGQQRKQYRLTAAGKKYLFGEIRKFTDRDAADEGAFLFRVALFAAMPQNTRRTIIAARKSFLSRRAAELSQLREPAPPGSFGMMAVDRVISRVEDELRWIDQLEQALRSQSDGMSTAES